MTPDPPQVITLQIDEVDDEAIRAFKWEHRFGDPPKLYAGWTAAPFGMTFDAGFPLVADQIRAKAKAILEGHNPGTSVMILMSWRGTVY